MRLMFRFRSFFCLILLAATARAQVATKPDAPPSAPAAQPRPGRTPAPIVLNADDKAAFAPAPVGFDQKRDGIAQGKLELVEYKSTTVGANRHMLIYTPPSYS